jgi:hypothetical protein
MTPASGQGPTPQRGTHDSDDNKITDEADGQTSDQTSDQTGQPPTRRSADLYGPDLTTLIETAPAPGSDVCALLRGYLPRQHHPPAAGKDPPGGAGGE